MFYREFEHHGKDLDAPSFIDNFRYILHYLCKNARRKALILHFQHGMIKLGITSLQVRQHRENFGFFFFFWEERNYLSYLPWENTDSSAKKAGPSSKDLIWNKRVNFVWERLHRQKSLWRRKRKLVLAWKIEPERTSQEKWHLKTQPSEILTISLEGRRQDGVWEPVFSRVG